MRGTRCTSCSRRRACARPSTSWQDAEGSLIDRGWGSRVGVSTTKDGSNGIKEGTMGARRRLGNASSIPQEGGKLKAGLRQDS